MKRNICVVTGTRAEFGLLRWLMQEVDEHPQLTLQVVATGMHLSPEFGSTYQEIEEAGFHIDSKVEMLLSSDKHVAIAKSIGLGIIGFADAFEVLAPDIVVLLGDRFEIYAAASAALVANIPIAHIHGGETTEGAFDEAFRHAITKMSQLHFVAADEYFRRVVQLGEQPERVFNVGGMGIDAIRRAQLMSREQLEESLGVTFSTKNLLVTFHPVTLEESAGSEQMQALLRVLGELEDTTLIFTMPNADTGGRVLAAMIETFVQSHPNSWVFTSLGQLRYFSCLAQVDGVMGNSSSGLLEAPAFNIGTINIGDRQKGRLKADSVIDCKPDSECIRKALTHLYSPEFQVLLQNIDNPYGNGGASKLVVRQLAEFPLEKVLKKQFFNLPIDSTSIDSTLGLWSTQ